MITSASVGEWLKCTCQRVQSVADRLAGVRDPRYDPQQLLALNPDKCKVMHIEHGIDTSYNMSIKGRCWTLDKITEESAT